MLSTPLPWIYPVAIACLAASAARHAAGLGFAGGGCLATRLARVRVRMAARSRCRMRRGVRGFGCAPVFSRLATYGAHCTRRNRTRVVADADGCTVRCFRCRRGYLDCGVGTDRPDLRCRSRRLWGGNVLGHRHRRPLELIQQPALRIRWNGVAAVNARRSERRAEASLRVRCYSSRSATLGSIQVARLAGT